MKIKNVQIDESIKVLYRLNLILRQNKDSQVHNRWKRVDFTDSIRREINKVKIGQAHQILDPSYFIIL